jgi:hypothetical protein
MITGIRRVELVVVTYKDSALTMYHTYGGSGTSHGDWRNAYIVITIGHSELTLLLDITGELVTVRSDLVGLLLYKVT